MKKVVLAYSGGLDTSICIFLLKERYNFDEVISVIVDVGQPEEDIKIAKERAERFADKTYRIDAKEEFVNDYIIPSIKANGCYEGYVLGTAIARPLIAKKVVDIAKKENAQALAHGCTGKGNDQLRFDFIFSLSGLDIIAPIRDLNLVRSWEIDYAKEKGLNLGINSKKPWSIDENLWSRSIEGGRLEDPWFTPPEEVYKWTNDPKNSPKDPALIEISFNDGIPIKLNNKELDGLNLIRELNKLGGLHGIGRTDMIEDRILGLKAREIYEHPAATILISAHKALEQIVLTKEEIFFKNMVDEKWSDLAYKGLIYEPLFDDINAFIDKTQERVCGDVRLKLFKGCLSIVGRRSPYQLYQEKNVSFEEKQNEKVILSEYHGYQAKIFKNMIIEGKN
ncbi:MAG: argininosuccinate synthase [Candidatus Methanoliparum thermophilum]|uniref:Argininosuccinate synthase n=2 Tax=Candidatus Methanoliparum TaxID=2545692 RepID=A0A520KTP4_METT2|nr:MAG: argininosuccinate synthase [Candidatus Methanoliparum thermophilum]